MEDKPNHAAFVGVPRAGVMVSFDVVVAEDHQKTLELRKGAR